MIFVLNYIRVTCVCTHTRSLPKRPGNNGQPSSDEHTRHPACGSQRLRLPPHLGVISRVFQLLEPKNRSTADGEG